MSAEFFRPAFDATPFKETNFAAFFGDDEVGRIANDLQHDNLDNSGFEGDFPEENKVLCALLEPVDVDRFATFLCEQQKASWFDDSTFWCDIHA